MQYLFLDITEEKPKIPKKREIDEESSDSKKIKTDGKTTEVGESEPAISPKEISSKKNVCNSKLYLHKLILEEIYSISGF